MTQTPSLDIAWVLIASALVLLMQAGFLCLEAGATRSKNSINVAIKNLSDFAVAALLFAIFGFSLMFGATRFGFFGPVEFVGAGGELGAREFTFFVFQVMFCGTATTIVSGAVAERMRFGGYLVAAAVLSGLVYTVFGHWAWNGLDGSPTQGWLRGLGFVDFAGSTVVHSVAGWSALALVMILGPRRGRFADDGTPRRIQGHDLPFAMLGAILLWIGWLGFNGGSALALNDRVPRILVNTLLAGSAGLVVGLASSWLRTGRSDVMAVLNGSLAGLVAITAGCQAVSPAAAMAIGSVGGLVMQLGTEALERARIDDVVGVIPVHGLAGVWGTVAVALFGDLEVLGTGLARTQQLGVQLLGAGVAFLWSFGLVYLIFRGVDRVFPLRVSALEEQMGLNVAEHGATTELLDLLVGMDEQARSGDLSHRVAVEPFTEVGQIASRYNLVMQSLEEAAEEADRIKNDFISTVSHELRTPLTSINASLGLMADGVAGELPSESRELVRIARENSDRLVRLITDILDIDRIESGRLEYDLRAIEIGKLLEQTIEAHRAFAGEQMVLLVLNDEAAGARVRADADRLVQVVTNLLSNALKFSPEGAPVEVSTARREGMIRVSVRDQGPGLPPSFHDLVFEKFTQADTSDRRRLGGTGLGLSICRAIIEDLGGRIDFETGAGAGTTFFFDLPELHGGDA
jgi:Amt family ammonium transporter